MSLLDRSLPAMGATARIVLADRAPGAAASPRLTHAADDAQALLATLERQWTRFAPDSALNLLNDDPRTEVPAGAHVRALIRAGAWAGRISGGLVDMTLGAQIAQAGYDAHWDGSLAVPLAAALAAAPPRAAATPDPAARWQGLGVDRRAGTIRRPPGVTLDSGGLGKGLAADLVAARLTGLRYVVDVGGDLALGHGGRGHHEVVVRHPLTDAPAHVFRLGGGGVATSGIHRRLWRDRHGDPAHHLLDPSTGRPAWTGLLTATAVGRSALHAETLAKTALLQGAHGARTTLSALGGVLVHEDGAVEAVPALRRTALRAARDLAAATA
ncbi:FAD:protein FMN transferase [Baekduia alba]|uniref:FAD:protein FMN transferase n=1 Tax=Baekduia alba TaxID=2997333 RepID=UPI00233FFCD7|nr:FAD:protein FMN transferase [Baekduia alba]WCB95799.1 FAD:protein FMN transferase [Baekduia alba]